MKSTIYTAIVRARLLAALCSVLTLCSVSVMTAWADDGTVGPSGKGIIPLQNDQVEMVAERVDIYPFHRWAYIEASFTLHNTGPATEILVGFPEEEYYPEHPEGRGQRPGTRDFTTEVDGSSLPTTYQPAAPPSEPKRQGPYRTVGWHTFALSFGEGQTREVKHSYFLQPSYSSNGAQIVRYLLQTGATWKGTIGRADIVVHPSGGYTLDDFIPWRGPGYTTWSDGKTDHVVEDGAIAWHLRDFEPSEDDDVFVYTKQLMCGPFVTDITPGTGETSPGDVIAYDVREYCQLVPWPAGSSITLYGGRDKTRLAETTLSEPTSNVRGEFVLPADLTPAHGRAVEIWAESEPGGIRTRSELLFIRDKPGTLPSGGGPPGAPAAVAALAAAATGLGLIGCGAAIRRRSRKRFG